MATRENEPSIVINIRYKTPLADGTKHIRIDMNVDKETVSKEIESIDDTSKFIRFTDMYKQIKYIPIDNIGEIEVY